MNERYSDPEADIVRRLRGLDLAAVQPGARERAWEKFQRQAGLPADPQPDLRDGERIDARGAATTPDQLVPPQGDLIRRLGFAHALPVNPRAPRRALVQP